jgi:hypothetical protein
MQSDQSDIPRKRARLDDGRAPQQHHAPLKLQPLLNAADTSKDGARISISADNLPQATSLTQFNNLQLQALKSLLQQYKVTFVPASFAYITPALLYSAWFAIQKDACQF